MCRGEGVNVPIVGVQGVSVGDVSLGDVFGGDGEDDLPVCVAQRAESLRSSSTTSSRSRPAGASRTHTTRRSGACRVRGEQSGPIHPCEQGAQGVAGKGHADGDVVDRLPVVLPAHEHHQVLRGRSARSAPATDGRNGSPNPGPRAARSTAAHPAAGAQVDPSRGTPQRLRPDNSRVRCCVKGHSSGRDTVTPALSRPIRRSRSPRPVAHPSNQLPRSSAPPTGDVDLRGGDQDGESRCRHR